MCPTPSARAYHRSTLRHLLPVLALCLSVPSGTAGAASDHDHVHHHVMPAAQEGYVRSHARYAIPAVVLTNADGENVALREELSDKPVVLNFIFTSCGAVCPVMSRTFSEVQTSLGKEIRLISISIDPEHDTPAVLKTYASKYGAGRHWQLLTGRLADSVAVQRAFDVYRGDKMNHAPATFLRAGNGQDWVRLDGFASANDILREYRGLASR
jgi:protein SCO1/2